MFVLNFSLQEFESLLENQFEKMLQALLQKLSIEKNVQKEFLNIDELANYISLSKSAIYKLVEKRAIPVIRLNKKLLFKPEEINKWVENSRG